VKGQPLWTCKVVTSIRLEKVWRSYSCVLPEVWCEALFRGVIWNLPLKNKLLGVIL
jgi:hypothetical protein